MKAQTGLGRGFDSLIPKGLNTESILSEGERIQNLLIKNISPSADQPRTHFDKESLNELAESIKRHGIVQPLIVTENGQDKYSIVAGERRWRAAKIVGLDRVPCIVRNQETLERLEVALIENVQRVDLTPLEQAVSIDRLHQQFNISYKDIANRLGKAATTVNNIVRLLQLPQTAVKALQENKITEGHARAILSLKGDEASQADLLKQIISHNWSVRQAEQYVVSHKQGLRTKSEVKKRMSFTTPVTEKLGKQLKTNVGIRRTAKGGRIEIMFKDDSDLDRILKQIHDQ